MVSGIVHLVRPEVFTAMVPRVLPSPRAWVLVSGVAELICGIGMLVPATRRPAGVASSALLVAVFPANVQMTIDAHRTAAEEPSRDRRIRQLITWARMPLQIPMVRAAWSATR